MCVYGKWEQVGENSCACPDCISRIYGTEVFKKELKKVCVNRASELAFREISMTPNQALHLVYEQLENLMLDESPSAVWGNDFIFRDAEVDEARPLFRKVDGNEFAEGIEQMKNKTDIVFQSFTGGVMFKIIPTDKSEFQYFDGCFTTADDRSLENVDNVQWHHNISIADETNTWRLWL